MFKVIHTNKFKKSLKRRKRRRKEISKLEEIVIILSEKLPLHMKYRNHKLGGDYEGCWELHIEPDWLLVYQIEGNVLKLVDTGTHSDLFE